jgi:hypothetical protein
MRIGGSSSLQAAEFSAKHGSGFSHGLFGIDFYLSDPSSHANTLAPEVSLSGPIKFASKEKAATHNGLRLLL